MDNHGLSECYDKIYKYCYYKVGNAQLAEDLTQETFLKYFAQNIKIEKGRQTAYLYTIARNLCIDSFRKRKEMENFEEGQEKCRTEGFCENSERKIVVRQAVKCLEEKQQELLFLRYVNELSIKEITAYMGISRFAVYRMERAALSALKKILNREDFYE